MTNLAREYHMKFLVAGDADVGKDEILESVLRISLPQRGAASKCDRTDDKCDGASTSKDGCNGMQIAPTTSTTILLEGTPVHLQLWDCGGQGRFGTILRTYSRGAQGVLLVFDITRRWSFDGIDRWIEEIARGQVGIGEPDRILDMGETDIPQDIFEEYLFQLGEDRFLGSAYHLLSHNCNTFSNDASQFLTGNPIPDYITGLPEEVLNTPFGRMVRPFLEQMMSQMGAAGDPLRHSNPTPQNNSDNGRAQPNAPSGNQKRDDKNPAKNDHLDLD